MDAFPINEEADLNSVGAKGPFGEKVMQASYGGRCTLICVAGCAVEMKCFAACSRLMLQGYSTTARTWLRPTLEAVGFWGGFTGAVAGPALHGLCSAE